MLNYVILVWLVGLVGLVRVLGETIANIPIDMQIGKEQGVSPSSSISADTLQKILAGVESGNRDNIYFYGLLKLYGISVTKDVHSAADLFLRASKLGHKEATTAFGFMKLTGMDGKTDYTEALKFLREGVKLGDMNAHWLLAKMLVESKGLSSPSYVEAALYLQRASDAHIPQAQHLLGVLYEYGLGVMQDLHIAAKFYRIASEQSYVEALYHLGLMYAYGRGVDQDHSRARSLFDAAARQNHAPSMYYMGIFKTYGYAGQVSYEQAVNWFERAAGRGDVRVAVKAAEAAKELRERLEEAKGRNEEIMDVFQSRDVHEG